MFWPKINSKKNNSPKLRLCELGKLINDVSPCHFSPDRMKMKPGKVAIARKQILRVEGKQLNRFRSLPFIYFENIVSDN